MIVRLRSITVLMAISSSIGSANSSVGHCEGVETGYRRVDSTGNAGSECGKLFLEGNHLVRENGDAASQLLDLGGQCGCVGSGCVQLDS